MCLVYQSLVCSCTLVQKQALYVLASLNCLKALHMFIYPKIQMIKFICKCHQRK